MTTRTVFGAARVDVRLTLCKGKERWNFLHHTYGEVAYAVATSGTVQRISIVFRCLRIASAFHKMNSKCGKCATNKHENGDGQEKLIKAPIIKCHAVQ